MQNLCLTISRLTLAAWVGAASLFVVTAVQEATSPDFDSMTKSSLALLRFPTYYYFGFVAVGTSFVSSIAACMFGTIGRRRAQFLLGLTGVALLLMVADYVWIFGPLEQMLAAEETARPASFQTYHNASMYVNFADLAMCLAAALLACWPCGRLNPDKIS